MSEKRTVSLYYESGNAGIGVQSGYSVTGFGCVGDAAQLTARGLSFREAVDLAEKWLEGPPREWARRGGYYVWGDMSPSRTFSYKTASEVNAMLRNMLHPAETGDEASTEDLLSAAASPEAPQPEDLPASCYACKSWGPWPTFEEKTQFGCMILRATPENPHEVPVWCPQVKKMEAEAAQAQPEDLLKEAEKDKEPRCYGCEWLGTEDPSHVFAARCGREDKVLKAKHIALRSPTWCPKRKEGGQ